jgi:thiol:disulfide interchange protein
MLTALALSLCAALPQTPAIPLQKPPQERPQIYDESADGAAQIAAALERAQRNETRVLIQWGANWCGWCHKLHELFEKNPEVHKELLYEYEVVLIDIGRWDKHMDLAEKYHAGLKGTGVPYLTVLDSKGEVLANQETGSLEKDGAHDPAKVMAFLKEHQAKPREAAPLIDAAIAQAKEQGKRVFLTFGAPWCGWCHRLEDWMWRPEVMAVLSKDFVPLKIDVDRTIGGKELLAKYRGGDGGGIPWFVFLDGEGQALCDSDDPGSNLGCPWSPEEIAAFGKLVARVKQRITDDELAALLKTMGPPKEKEEPAEGAGSGS